MPQLLFLAYVLTIFSRKGCMMVAFVAPNKLDTLNVSQDVYVFEEKMKDQKY